MAGWLDGIGISVRRFSLPRCGFSLSLFGNCTPTMCYVIIHTCMHTYTPTIMSGRCTRAVFGQQTSNPGGNSESACICPPPPPPRSDPRPPLASALLPAPSSPWSCTACRRVAATSVCFASATQTAHLPWTSPSMLPPEIIFDVCRLDSRASHASCVRTGPAAPPKPPLPHEPVQTGNPCSHSHTHTHTHACMHQNSGATAEILLAPPHRMHP